MSTFGGWAWSGTRDVGTINSPCLWSGAYSSWSPSTVLHALRTSDLPLSYFATTFGVGRIKPLLIHPPGVELIIPPRSLSAALYRVECRGSSPVCVAGGVNIDPTSNFCTPWSGIIHSAAICFSVMGGGVGAPHHRTSRSLHCAHHCHASWGD